jgi:ESS family glutamate:Na+ symporter
MVYGSGIGLFLGLPVLILLTVPMNFFNNELYGYWIVFGLIIGYLLLLWGFWHLIGFIKFKNPYPKQVD